MGIGKVWGFSSGVSGLPFQVQGTFRRKLQFHQRKIKVESAAIEEVTALRLTDLHVLR